MSFPIFRNKRGDCCDCEKPNGNTVEKFKRKIIFLINLKFDPIFKIYFAYANEQKYVILPSKTQRKMKTEHKIFLKIFGKNYRNRKSPKT